MNRFNKPMKQIDAMKSVRKTWEFNPNSRVVPNKKKYSRKNQKPQTDD